MPFLSKCTLAAALVTVAPVAFAQDGGTSRIVVEQPWARATPAGAPTGAAYATLVNKSNAGDQLTAASSDVAATVQIHQMSVVKGVMEMHQLADGLAIPAGASVTLKPGSYHVMLIGLKKPLIAGETLPLTLTFANAGNISVTVPIKPVGATQSSAGSMNGMAETQGKKPGSMRNMEMK